VNVFARTVSVLFHPLLMATYLFALLSWTLPSALLPLQPASHLTFIALIFIVTFLLPVSNIGIFKMFGTIRSFSMEERRERIIPFLFISAIYLAVTYLLYSKTGLRPSDNFLKLMIIVDLLVIISTIATFFFKVSVHSIAIWGLAGITLLLTKIAEVNTLFYVTIALIVLAGIVMSSRLYLQAHNSREVMWGAVLGLATSIAGMLILF
jgi:hypothetical protein